MVCFPLHLHVSGVIKYIVFFQVMKDLIWASIYQLNQPQELIYRRVKGNKPLDSSVNQFL